MQVDETKSTDNNDTGTQRTPDFVNTEKDAEKLQETARVIGKPFQKGFDDRRNYNGAKKKRFEEYYTEEEIAELVKEIKEKRDKSSMLKEAEMVFGKPKQPLVGGDEDDSPITITGINYILPDGTNSKTRPETEPSVSSD